MTQTGIMIAVWTKSIIFDQLIPEFLSLVPSFIPFIPWPTPDRSLIPQSILDYNLWNRWKWNRYSSSRHCEGLKFRSQSEMDSICIYSRHVRTSWGAATGRGNLDVSTGRSSAVSGAVRRSPSVWRHHPNSQRPTSRSNPNPGRRSLIWMDKDPEKYVTSPQ